MPRVLVTFVPDQPGFRAAAEASLRTQCPELLEVCTGPSELPGRTQLTFVMPDASSEDLAQRALAKFAGDCPMMAFQVPAWPTPTVEAYGLGRS